MRSGAGFFCAGRKQQWKYIDCLWSFLLGNDCHSFTALHQRYTLYFKGWYQQNDVHKTKRLVRRRPAEFVTKQNMKDIAHRYLNSQELKVHCFIILTLFWFQTEWNEVNDFKLATELQFSLLSVMKPENLVLVQKGKCLSHDKWSHLLFFPIYGGLRAAEIRRRPEL